MISGPSSFHAKAVTKLQDALKCVDSVKPLVDRLAYRGVEANVSTVGEDNTFGGSSSSRSARESVQLPKTWADAFERLARARHALEATSCRLREQDEASGTRQATGQGASQRDGSKLVQFVDADSSSSASGTASVLPLCVADPVDAKIEAALRARETALADYSALEDSCKDEQRQIKDLTRDVVELERALASSRGRRRQKLEESGAERHKALQRRLETAEQAFQELTEESEKLTSLLTAANMRNASLGLDIDRFEAEYKIAVEENQAALRARGEDRSLEAFRRRNAQECAVAAETFRTVCEESEDHIDKLTDNWNAQQSRYLADLQELARQARDLEERLDAKQLRYESALQEQRAQSAKAVDETEAKANSELRRLDEVRQQKAQALNKQVAISRQFLQEDAAGKQRAMEVQLNEARRAFMHKVKMTEQACRMQVAQERQLVQSATKDRQILEKRAVRTREGFRAHAIKSGSYMRTLSGAQQRGLVNLWSARP
eukprot:TRINITY_DN17559_c2_g1_i1.p1 TRINITY_DN17559_c2_g1~~TRINITY_DN17559_c2_g1_i1.p1  ORF type:complete len:492 (-),score=124.38 TRINITY_DN17559_c2_g1_i1:153-1628(-)